MWVETWALQLRVPLGKPAINDIPISQSRDNWLCVVHVCTLLDTHSFPEEKKPISWGAHEKWEHSPPAARQLAGPELILCLVSLGTDTLQQPCCLEVTPDVMAQHALGAGTRS